LGTTSIAAHVLAAPRQWSALTRANPPLPQRIPFGEIVIIHEMDGRSLPANDCAPVLFLHTEYPRTEVVGGLESPCSRPT
jgi:hypothetical protein